MPRNRLQERPYDPISADLVRDVTTAGRFRSVPVGERPPPRTSLTTPVPTITKRFVLTRAEDVELNAFLLRLQESSGTKVSLSVLVRAALTVVMGAEARIFAQVADVSMDQPSTHDRLALGEFEDFWKRSLAKAFG